MPLSRFECVNCVFDGALFADAVLEGADFSETKLDGAVFSSAKLGGADLTNARLAGASLKSALLGEAQLNGAVLDGTQFNVKTTLPFTKEVAVGRGMIFRPLVQVGLWAASSDRARVVPELKTSIMSRSDVELTQNDSNDLTEFRKMLANSSHLVLPPITLAIGDAFLNMVKFDLVDFVYNGGTIIALTDNNTFLQRAGLIATTNCTASVDVGPLPLADRAHFLATGLKDQVAVAGRFYGCVIGDSATSIMVGNAARAHVFSRKRGKGQVVFIGHGREAVNADAETMLANALAIEN